MSKSSEDYLKIAIKSLECSIENFKKTKFDCQLNNILHAKRMLNEAEQLVKQEWDTKLTVIHAN